VVTDFTSDAEWRAQLDGLRASLAGSIGHVRVFADTTDVGRASAAGFDGLAIYDNQVGPDRYLPIARAATERGLLFSFNVNAGFSAIAPRRPAVNECGQPTVSPPFTPSTDDLDLTTAAGRELAAALSRQRMVESFAATVAAQTNAALSNAQRGFFLAYVNSFNEWHEGSAFEPMKDAAALSPAERLAGYYNPARGDYRLALFKELLAG
jgi:hypothetical protein